jgi:phosphate-selective porin
MIRAFALAGLLLAASPAAAEDPWRPRLEHKEADFRLDLTGYLQFDFAAFPNWSVAEGLRRQGSELRRARVGLEGKWRRLHFELDVDPDGDFDYLGDLDYIKDAYLELRLAREVRVRGGHFKLPLSTEYLGSASKTDFVERSLATSRLGPARDVGLMVWGEIGKKLLYQVGVFAGDGRTRSERAGTTGAWRFVLTPTDGLDFGAAFTQGEVKADPVDAPVDPEPKGFDGRDGAFFRFFQPHFVNGTRRRLDLSAAYSRGPIAFKAEGLRAVEERLGQGSLFDDLPDLAGTGWAVSWTWLVTREKKKTTIVPSRSLFRGPGAIEVGLRYESLRFDDNGPDVGFAGAGNRARNVRPGGVRAFTAGLSWWPIPYLRLMANALVERFEDPLLAPEPGRQSNYVTVLSRLQLQLP